jgi:protein ImuA
MIAAARQAALSRLRQRLEKLERPQWLKAAAAAPEPAPLPHLEASPGALSEVRAADWRDGPAALGFALALSGRRAAAASKAIVFLGLAHEARRDGLLFGRSLSAYGVNPAGLVAAFAKDAKALLWAAEEATRSDGVAAVIVDIPAPAALLDLTATRRLSLAAAASGASAILVRTMKAPEPTAAVIRWRVAASASAPDPHDRRASGNPRWIVEIERCRKGGRGAWVVEHHHDGLLVCGPARPVPQSLAAAVADRPPEAAPFPGPRYEGAACSL